MSRLHLFELADQGWYPRTLADAGTAYLNTLQEKAGLSSALAPLVQRALDESGAERIVDLCSGGGGPVVAMRSALSVQGSVPALVLTDLQPSEVQLAAQCQSDGVSVHGAPVDARSVPAELTGLRTVFNALHHLRPDHARALLADAQAAGQPVLVVELSERNAVNLTLGAAFIPLLVFLLMPLVRPVRLSWLLLTYLVPVLPWTIQWDGWVIHWRTYSLAEQAELVAPLQRDGWSWTMGQEKVGPGKVTWLLGRPALPG